MWSIIRLTQSLSFCDDEVEFSGMDVSSGATGVSSRAG